VKHFIAKRKIIVVQPALDAMMKRGMEEVLAGNWNEASLAFDISFGCLLIAGVNLIGRQGQDFRKKPIQPPFESN
jgi:hypothetical protein